MHRDAAQEPTIGRKTSIIVLAKESPSRSKPLNQRDFPLPDALPSVMCNSDTPSQWMQLQ